MELIYSLYVLSIPGQTSTSRWCECQGTAALYLPSQGIGGHHQGRLVYTFEYKHFAFISLSFALGKFPGDQSSNSSGWCYKCSTVTKAPAPPWQPWPPQNLVMFKVGT